MSPEFNPTEFMKMIFSTRKHCIRKLVGCAIIIVIFISIYMIGKCSQTLQISTSDALKSLPYLAWAPAEDTIEKKGVIKYDQTKSFEGINVYCAFLRPATYLIDMYGNILHKWEIEAEEGNHYYIGKILKNGDLLLIITGKLLIRLDWDSNIKWMKRMPFEHDIAVSENNTIYSIIEKTEKVFKFGLSLPVLNNYIVVLSADGKLKKEISMFKVLEKEIPPGKFIRIYYEIIIREKVRKWAKSRRKPRFKNRTPIDILHINTIEIIDQDIAGLCKKGDLLFCARELDLIGILDVKKEKLIWSWGPGNLDRPHHPTFLKNGNILIFDNGTRRRYSRVVELEPLVRNVVWEYKSNPLSQFYSKSKGASQRLSNRNTLITESDKGRVFEVTPDGEIVWEFYCPEIKIDLEGTTRAVIYRMMRITDPENYPCLKNLVNSGDTILICG